MVERLTFGATERIMGRADGPDAVRTTYIEAQLAPPKGAQLVAKGVQRQRGGGQHSGKPRQLRGSLPYLYAQAYALNPHFQSSSQIYMKDQACDEGAYVSHI